MPNPYLDPYDPDPNKWGTAIGAGIGGVFGGPIGAGVGGWIGSKFGNNKPDVINVNQDDLTPAPFANGVGGYSIPGVTPAPGTPPKQKPLNGNPWTTGHSDAGFTSDPFHPEFGSGFGQTPLYNSGWGTPMPNTGGDGGLGIRQPKYVDDNPFEGGATGFGSNLGSSTPATPASAPNPFLSGPAASDYSSLYRNPAPRPQQNPFKFF